MKEYQVIGHVDGMETSILGLQFTVKPHHFRKGDLKLKCTATLGPTLYWKSNEASAEPDRPYHQRSSTSTLYQDSALASAAITVHILGYFYVI